MQINHHTLKNGLRIVHIEDKTTQMVAINTLYDVGARDENPEQTGFAHLFEHLMFGGTKLIPDFDTVIQNAGGESNAWTNNDITNYYITLPHQNAETGFYIEADRMKGIDFSQQSLDNQKQVVIEEFKQRNLNQPYGDVGMLMRDMAYKVHPYRWSTIGKDISHIESATLNDVKDFFFKHYIPSNAILAVTGNISFEKTVEWSEKWFTLIPSPEKPVRNLPAESLQTEARSLHVQRNVPVSAFYRVYKMPERKNGNYPCIDLLSDILSNGASSRLFRSLVKEKKIASEVNAYISGDMDPGLFYVYGKPAEGFTLKDIEESVDAELQKLKKEIIGEPELDKVKNKFESNKIFSEINYLNKASNIAYYELLGNAEYYFEELEKYRLVSRTDIQETAKKIFNINQSSTLYYNAELS